MASSSSSAQQTPISISTTQHATLDITYRLICQSVHGAVPSNCSSKNEHLRIKHDTSSHLNLLIVPTTQFVCYRAHFAWANYRGDLTGAYSEAEDTVYTSKLVKESLQRNAGADSEISEAKITMIKEHDQNGTLVANGGRYVRLDLKFEGPQARSAKVWGKRVTGGVNAASVELNGEEIRRLGVVGTGWTWKDD